jgi:hypothetical protein
MPFRVSMLLAFALALPSAITMAVAQDDATAPRPASFQIRGFYVGMTLGQFNSQMKKEFGREIGGFILQRADFSIRRVASAICPEDRKAQPNSRSRRSPNFPA